MNRGSSFAQPTAIATEVYRNAEGKTRVLRYRTMARVRSGRVTTRHLVLIDHPALERGTETLADVPTAEEARDAWRQGRVRMSLAGYSRVEFAKKGE